MSSGGGVDVSVGCRWYEFAGDVFDGDVDQTLDRRRYWNLLWSRRSSAGIGGPTIQAVCVFAVFWLVCLYLYRSKIFFRI